MQDHTSPTGPAGDHGQVSIYECQTCKTLLLVETDRLHEQDHVECRHCSARDRTKNVRARIIESHDDLDAARELRSRIAAARAGDDAWAQGEHDAWAEIEERALDPDLIPDARIPDEAAKYDDWWEDSGDGDQSDAERRAMQTDLVPMPGEPDPDADVETSIGDGLDPATQAEADAYVEASLSSGPSIETADEVVDPTQQDLDISCAPVTQPQVGDVVLRDVGPRRSEWVPEVIENLLPVLVREISTRARSHPAAPLQTERPGGFVEDLLADFDLDEYDPGVGGADASVSRDGFAAAAGFVRAVAQGVVDRAHRRDGPIDAEALAGRILAHWRDPQSDPPIDSQASWRHAPDYSRLGTGDGPFNAGLDAVYLGLLRPLRDAERVPAVHLRLDGPAWADVADPRTRERALNAIAALAAVVDVRLVCSPATRSLLDRHHEAWVQAALVFTPAWDRCRERPAADPLPEEVAVEDVHATVAEYGAGHRRLLKAIQAAREQRTLADDPDVALDASSVSAYLGDLESDDFVTRDTTGRTNVVEPTARSDAIRPYIAHDGTLRDPHQTDWSAPFTDPRHDSDKCSVTREGLGQGGPAFAAGDGRRAQSAEAALAATGSPADGAAWIQWVTGTSETGVLDRYGAHKRLSAVSQGPGVTLHDYPIDPLDDGRVTRYSAFDDRALALVQWGDPLSMMVRLTRTLLSDQAFGKVLTKGAIGTSLDRLFDGQFGPDAPDAARSGSQCGWLSTDHEDYEDYRDRLQAVASTHLERLSEIDRGDTDARAELFADANGLLATATHLYRAADVDLQVTIRMPDTETVRTDSTQRANFVRFLREVIPKSSAYGIHNANRHLVERRGEKLRRRRPVNVDGGDPLAELIPEIVVTGPTASALRPAVEGAIEGVEEDLREQVRSGSEETFALEVPVRVANGYAGTKAVVEAFVDQKGYGGSESNVRKLVDVLRAALRSERRGVSPADVCEVCLRLASATREGAVLDVDDLHHGLGALPPDRLVAADVAPSAAEMLSALLASDEPLTVADLIDAAGVSERSYERHRSALVALGIIDRADDGQGWEATLVPWWSPYWAPEGIDHIPGQPETATAALREILTETGSLPPPEQADKLLSGVSKGSSKATAETGGDPSQTAERDDLLAVLEGYINPHFDAPEQRESSRTVIVGPTPVAADPAQTSLQTAAAGGAD